VGNVNGGYRGAGCGVAGDTRGSEPRCAIFMHML